METGKRENWPRRRVSCKHSRLANSADEEEEEEEEGDRFRKIFSRMLQDRDFRVA